MERDRNRLPASSVLWCGLIMLLVLGLGSRPGLAQMTRANLSGTIVDESGGALPGVTVTITNLANGAQQVLVTGGEGEFRAVALQPAPHEVRAELQGFGEAVREIVLTIGANATLDITLGIATISEALTVSAVAPLVEVAKSAPSSIILDEQIMALPTLERNFLALAQTMPGATPSYGKFARVRFGGPADQRNGYTTIVDGGDLDDAIWGDPTVNISQDAVQEFKVSRNQFDAQYGAALSAVVTVATRSGTNEVHGSGYFFGRDDSMNATNAFASTKPVYEQQRLGGTVGGPIARDKTHLFTSYEYNHVKKENIISLPSSNPFAAQENGIFPAGTREHLLIAKLDHRLSDDNSFFVRYAVDDQYSTSTSSNVTSETSNVNDSSKMHSLIGEDTWILSDSTVNTLRAHYMWNEVSTIPVTIGVPQEVRPSVTFGQNWTSPQFFPRSRVQFFNTLYKTAGRHDLKFGADYTYAKHSYEAHFYENGQWRFDTDAPFDANDPSTHPFAFIQQTTGLYDYNSHIFAAYVQDDWRVSDRLRLNLGLRYDLDTNLRMNDVYATVLADPAYAGLDNFVSSSGRGTDSNNFQPRLGLTFDVRGDGTLVARAGWGLYVTRNRHYFGLTAQDRLLGSSVRISDPAALANYPSASAVLGGRSLADYIAAGGARSVYIIPDDYVLPESQNTTVGFGWQLNNTTAIDVDYVHAYGYNQLGGLDLNLPASGALNASNPRPVPQFTEVKSLENFTKSWYDAVETQFRTRFGRVDNLRVSYTLSRSWRDGVTHYQTYPGTMRTPNEAGYNEDNRHNLSVSAAGSLPFGIQLSGILQALSGSPHNVSAGRDLDGDRVATNDRPAGLPISVGRNVAEELRIINEFRTSIGRAPITEEHLKLDPFITLSLRLTKAFTFPNAQRMELFLEGYNILNRVNFSNGGTGNMSSGAMLVRRAARDARQVQLGARFQF